MKRFEKTRSNPALAAAVWLAAGAVFAADLLVPLGIVVWIFYLVPVSLTLYEWKPRLPLRVAAAATAFIAIGFLTAKPSAGFPTTVVEMNRAFGVVTIWAVALVARQFLVSKIRLREQEWIRAGQRELSARMQGELHPGELGERILSFLCEYLEVPVGALYAAERDGAFRRRATYAAGAALAARDVLAPGDDLAGQAIRGRRILRFDDLPPEYLPVASATLRTKPRHLVVAPVEVDGAVNGVIELGFLHPVGLSDMDLLETMAEPIAVALRSAEYRVRQAELLTQTQQQAEELQAQQEELRVTNEELEEQSRALKESQARLEAQQAELEQTNAHLEEQAQELERQRDELARAQGELVERADELTRANQYKSEFLANMSHELRTPLNSALILAKLLADNRDGNLTEEQVRYASTIYSSGNDLLVLINDILDLSRIEAGRMELHVESADVHRLVAGLERTFQPMAEHKGLTFEARVDPGTPETLTSDGLRIQQILRNLLSNAFKFTVAGSVSLHVAPAPEGRVVFTVKDSGIGIPVDQQEVIFEAFRQADGTTNRLYGGTGLGLTISRELARRLGGDITVESAPGSGSVFTLVLPCVVDEPRRDPEPAPEPAPPARPPAMRPAPPSRPAEPSPSRTAVEDDRDTLAPGDRSILVIEDDLAFARILRDLAREERFRALVATSAAEGLKLAERFVPSAVLLDVHLPDDSGLSVLERLKKNPVTRHIPVHIASVADHVQQALEMGAVGYAIKPVGREELVATMKKIERRLAQKVRSVLVVEDASVQRESIVELLKAEDVRIVPVATAAEALACLKETTFDCMVLDLTLPDMSGYEMLDRMAAGEAYSFPPVIVYTGRSLTRDEEERLRPYASSIIIKGAKSPERLLDEVMLFLHKVESELPAEQQRMLRAVRNRESALEGRTILVVDDDARNVFALASVLENRGAKVRLARNGKEALAALDGPDPRVDLVLMDIMMPEMDGLTAMREIRRKPARRKMPIIALTAKAMPRDRDECIRAGADDYIAKPLDVDRLLSLIKVWIPKQGPA